VSKGPTIVNEKWTGFGWVQINPKGGYTQSEKLNELYQSVNGDLGRIREIFCKD